MLAYQKKEESLRATLDRGKNPAIVWDPPDLDEAVRLIVGAAYACSGQRCTSISRVIVPRILVPRIETALRDAVEALRPGDGMDDATTLGPLVRAAHLARIEGFVERALADGARRVCGGYRLTDETFTNGYFYAPTILSDVTGAMEIGREEVFGPVLVIQPVDSIEQALSLTNDVAYGLTASIFARDLALVGRFVEGLQSGMVHVNHGTAIESHLPSGGVKASGMGPGSIGSTTKDFYAFPHQRRRAHIRSVVKASGFRVCGYGSGVRRCRSRNASADVRVVTIAAARARCSRSSETSVPLYWRATAT